MRATIVASLLVGASAFAAGCGLFPTLSQLEGGCAGECGGASSAVTTSSTGDAPASGGGMIATTGMSSTSTTTGDTSSSGTGGASPCPGIHGPTMVHFVSPAGVSICIDSTQVTVDQYLEFITATTQMTSLPVEPECAFKNDLMNCNTDADVGGACGTLSCCVTPLLYVKSYYDGAGASQHDHPMLGIDYCDAEAYCSWAHKRLCGTTDPSKKQGDLVTPAQLPTSEWGLACHGPGTLPFGFTSNPDVAAAACNINNVSSGNPFEHTTGVDENPSCTNTWPGGSVTDMIGNEFEAENNCDDSGGGNHALDKCTKRGSTYFFNTSYANCDFTDINTNKRNAKDVNSSFRCCADPN